MLKHSQYLLLATVLLSETVTTAKAAILSNVPMQGSMVMPMLRYDAVAAALRVTVDPTVPELVPLLSSNPGDSFNATDPWFEFLDPSARGLAFSRRYGFVMDTMTDQLPPGTSILIRNLSSSPGLGIYRFRATDPKCWTPIFGTDSSPDSLVWDGMMFHPGFTAPAGTNRYSAEFEAVLIESGSGMEMAGTSTGPFRMNWVAVPDGRPALDIAYKVVITCPVASDYVLEATDRLTPSHWIMVTNSVVTLDGLHAVVLDPSPERKFFRMRREP